MVLSLQKENLPVTVARLGHEVRLVTRLKLTTTGRRKFVPPPETLEKSPPAPATEKLAH